METCRVSQTSRENVLTKLLGRSPDPSFPIRVGQLSSDSKTRQDTNVGGSTIQDLTAKRVSRGPPSTGRRLGEPEGHRCLSPEGFFPS